jgi:rubrerythrin
MAQQPQKTQMSNHQYDLVSVLYHALEGAQTYEVYVKDAQQAGDQELTQFFQQAQQQSLAMANQAQKLLSSRVSAS